MERKIEFWDITHAFHFSMDDATTYAALFFFEADLYSFVSYMYLSSIAFIISWQEDDGLKVDYLHNKSRWGIPKTPMLLMLKYMSMQFGANGGKFSAYFGVVAAKFDNNRLWGRKNQEITYHKKKIVPPIGYNIAQIINFV